MKKLLTILMASAFALSMSATALAADAQITPDSGENTGNTNVTYTVNPGYTVTIPENVTLGNTATVEANDVSVEKGKSVVVRLSGTSGTGNAFTVKNNENAELTYTVTDGGTTTYNIGDTILSVATSDTALGSGSKTLTFTEPENVIYAGTYKGTVTFTVSVE